MENNTKFCTSCGKQIPADAQFCSGCGAPQAVAEAPQNAETVVAETPVENYAPAAQTAPKGGVSVILTKILSPLIVASIALIMFITAFLPVIKISTGTDKSDSVYKIGAFNAVTFMFDSLKSVESEDLQDSLLYAKFEDNYELLYDEVKDLDIDDFDSYNELPARVKKLMNKTFILQTRMELQSEETKTNLSIVIAGLTALLYIVASVAFFAFALLNLVKALTANSDEEAKGTIEQSKLNMLFFAIPMVLAITYFSGIMSLASIGMSNASMSLAGAASFTFVVVFLAFAASVALEIVFNLEKFISTVKEKLMKLIGVGAALVLSVALLIALSSPILTAAVSAKFGGRNSEKTVNIPLETSYFAGLGMTEDEKEYADERFERDEDVKSYAVENLFDDFEYYTTKQIKDGKANSDNLDFVNGVSVYAGIYKTNFIYGLIALLYIVAFALSAYGVWSSLVAIVNGKKIGPSLTLANAIVVAVAVVLALVFAMAVNGAVKGFEIDDYSLGLSFGAICALLFAAGAKACEVVLGKMEAKVAIPVAEAPAETAEAPSNEENI